jgi:hypothetical protein
VSPDPLSQDGHEPAQDLRPHFGVEVLLEVHGTGHVGEQDGDLETLRRRAAHAGPIHDDTFLYRVEFHVVRQQDNTRR